ncbi:MAG: sulfatase-like hydrolase/transferase [Deltaproteobacteria bacterium]|nr:sulfatase-like hydrolase/transferase [Deltaproteobacteria bacterium]
MQTSRLGWRWAIGFIGLPLALACSDLELKENPLPSARTQGLEAAGEIAAARVAPADAPDVLLITIDTLRADHVGAYGAVHGATPNIDRLAKESVLFESALTTAPLTLPAHASMLTGLLPPQHGVRHNGVYFLRNEARTLAEGFREGGWATGAVLGAFVLSSQFGLQQGFDLYDDHFDEHRSSGSGFVERSATEVTDQALRWVESVDSPFFLWVHYYDPHADYQPAEPYASRFASSPYVGEIAYTDAEFGRLLDALRARDRWANTVVALTSDHGEGLGEHGESTHGYFLYESVLRVPLLLRGPGLSPGSRRSDPVSNAAVGPTLVSLAKLPPLDSSALPSLVEADQERATPIYAETLAPQLDFGWAPLSATRGDQFAYIHAPKPELYDVEADPQQLHNLLETQPAEGARQARLRLEQQVASVLADAATPNRRTIDAETARRIEALGYLVTQAPPVRTGMNPKDGQRWIELTSSAMTAYFDNRFDDAEAEASEVLEVFPESGKMRAIMARMALATGRPEEALAHVEALVRIHPDDAGNHVLLGMTLLRMQKLKKAVAAFETGVDRDEGHFGAHLGAMWKGALGSPQAEVERHAERAIELSGGGPAILEQVGETWEGLGDFDQALATYQRGLEEDPDSERLHMRMAIQHARRNEPAAFQAHIERAGAAGTSPDLLNRLGIALAARGAHRDAEMIFRGLLARHPGNQIARLNLARVFEQTGRASEAASLRSGEALPSAPAHAAP